MTMTTIPTPIRMTSDAQSLNEWHQEEIQIGLASKRWGGDMLSYLRRQNAVWGPVKDAPMPIRGRCDLIDDWVDEEYRDEMPIVPESKQPIWETIIW